MVQSISETVIDTRNRLIASAIIDYCEPLVNTRLISEKAFAVLKECASLFPLSLTPFFCFEIALHEEENTADFLFCISDPTVLSEAFRCNMFLKRLVNRNPFYKRLHDLSEMWQGGKPALTSIQNIWFEFDYVDMKQGFLNPSFFYAPAKLMNSLRTVHVTDLVFETIAGQHLSKETAKTLLHILIALPRPSWVSQIGKMLSRQTTSVRLFIQDVAKDGVGALLKVAGYKYVDDERFESLLKLGCAFADQVDVDIDIEESGKVGPVAGLECSFNHLERALYFLDHLHGIAICSKHKRDALFNFLKSMHLKQDLDYQPFLAHFKLVYQPDRAIKAKVYVGYADSRRASSITRTKIL
jgi:hypothetical protein